MTQCRFATSLFLAALITSSNFAHEQHQDPTSKFMLAIANGDAKRVEYYLKQGVNVEMRNEEGATPLIIAARLGHVEVAKLLLQYHARINVADHAFKDTALKWACYNGHIKVVALLLEHKADLQMRDKEGNTAIIDATRKGRVEIVALLIKHGALVDDQNYKGHTPFAIAKKSNDTKMMTLLRQHKADETLGQEDEDALDASLNKLAKLDMPKGTKKELRRLIIQMQQQSNGPEKAMVSDYLNLVLDELPWGVHTTDNLDIANVQKVLDEDHYGLKEVKKSMIDFIATLNFKKDGKAPIICLVGPPGVGKTSLGKSIARALGRKYERIALGGVHDESELRGHRRTYIGARPGRFIQALKHAKSMNPVIVIDEIDKVSSGNGLHGDPYAALLEILDPEQNKEFRDNYLEIPFDLSKVLFIATANSVSNIPHALRDRMEFIFLESYTEDEKLAIAQQHLLQQVIKDTGLEAHKITISPEVIRKLIREYSHEAGVRQLKRLLNKLMAKIARGLLEKKKLISVDAKNLEKHLGPGDLNRDETEHAHSIGIVNGLAVFSHAGGGTMTKIEALITPRTPREPLVVITSEVSAMVQESVQRAFALARTRAKELGFDDGIFNDHAVHINWSDKSFSPLDGASAGLAQYVAIVSALTRRPVNSLYAMTGAINLRGHVMVIGGLRDKILAAKNVGMRYIVIPHENKKDLEDMDPSVIQGIEIIPVKDVSEVLKRVLM